MLSNTAAIFQLLKKEVKQEVKQQNATWVIVLYVLSSVFVSYLSFKRILSVNTWVALFWLIVLFGTFNATLRVFDKESEGRHYFLSQIASPIQIIWSKSLFASLLSFIVAVVGFLVFSVLLGFPEQALGAEQYAWFFLLILLSSIGLGFLLVLINGLAFKSGNSGGMATILGLPVALPLLLLIIRIAQHVIAMQPAVVFQKYLGALGVLDLILIVLSSLLFPYLWRD